MKYVDPDGNCDDLNEDYRNQVYCHDPGPPAGVIGNPGSSSTTPIIPKSNGQGGSGLSSSKIPNSSVQSKTPAKVLNIPKSNQLKGREGEAAVAQLTGLKKNTTTMKTEGLAGGSGKARIPDSLDKNTGGIHEVKNIAYQSFTSQLKDDIA